MSFRIFLLHILKSNEAENLFGCFYEHQSFMSALGHWTWLHMPRLIALVMVSCSKWIQNWLDI